MSDLEARAASAGTSCMGRPARLRAEASPFIFATQAVGALRACPRCGSEYFSQKRIPPAARGAAEAP